MTISHNPIIVTIVIPCFNQQALLARALRSCLQQSYSHLDIIVVDDGSTPAIQYPTELGNPDNRVRVIQQHNTGVAEARNHGLRYAKGSFIKFLDADDELLPHCILHQVQLLANLPRHICFSGYRLVKGTQSIEGVPKFDQFLQGIIMGNVAPLHAGLYPTDTVRDIGGFDCSSNTVLALEDYDFHWKLALKGIEVITWHQIGVIYYKLPKSRSTDMANHFNAYIGILVHYLQQLILQHKLNDQLKITALHSLAELAMQSDNYAQCLKLFTPFAPQFCLPASSARAQKLGYAIAQRLDTACCVTERAWWALLKDLCPNFTASSELCAPAYGLRTDSTAFAVQQFDGPVLAHALKMADDKSAIWLWGKGIWCRYWLHMLRSLRVEIAGIIDSNASLNERYLEYTCLQPNNVDVKENQGIIICSRDSYLMLRQECQRHGWQQHLIDYLAGQ
ncbi:hypothetical protein GCM10010919_19050 [Alishewanella longhuensis]|uniref:Glycosyltransferase 2-like domain-containing protein n=1 Tax=Alishewanella longhuensis TaxID=1091037 RepID=A0ABQ3KYF4_9ALTE|nr:glycosyltransferase family 2 protein [Alishewanella longhuensis]GHG69250.1 hypothetical protein GCM10010919_19050 [Alishewanella longhuensis]